jgi:hypothetical protein
MRAAHHLGDTSGAREFAELVLERLHRKMPRAKAGSDWRAHIPSARDLKCLNADEQDSHSYAQRVLLVSP